MRRACIRHKIHNPIDRVMSGRSLRGSGLVLGSSPEDTRVFRIDITTEVRMVRRWWWLWKESPASLAPSPCL